MKERTVRKIGVLTFHRCINYGSYWQARCLVEGLRARGHDAVLLDHESRRVNLSELRCAYQPTLPTPVPESDYPLYRKKMQRFFRAFEALPLSPRFLLQDPSQMESYDVVVVGSDEVWNIFHPWYGKCPLFYGDGIRTDRLISYAASFGNYPAAWGLEPSWAEKLRNFDAISVRDENSLCLIKKEVGVEPELVLDPCLQFSVTPEEEPIYENRFKPYIAVYGHNFTGAFAQQVQQWAARKNLSLISIGYRNDWADEQWLTAGPHDFFHFIKQAEAVVTNFFHGCVFALCHAKPFACEATPYRSNKVHGLMTLLHGTQHLVTSDTTAAVYDALLSQPLEPHIIENIHRLRETSDTYLDKALNAQQLQVA